MIEGGGRETVHKTGIIAQRWKQVIVASALPIPLVQQLQRIFAQHPPPAQTCDAAAAAVFQVLNAAGLSPRIVQVTDQFGALFFFAKTGELFSSTGVHQAVEANGIVYDALTGADGLSLPDYIEMLENLHIYPALH